MKSPPIVNMKFWIAFVLIGASVLQIVVGSAKKGVSVPGEAINFKCSDVEVLNRVSWWYDWGNTPVWEWNGCSNVQPPT